MSPTQASYGDRLILQHQQLIYNFIIIIHVGIYYGNNRHYWWWSQLLILVIKFLTKWSGDDTIHVDTNVDESWLRNIEPT